MADTKVKEDYRQVLTDKLIEQLEAGTAPWLKPWDPSKAGERGRLPFNPTTGKAYRGANSLWLSLVAASKGFDDPRWATYRQAEAQGWQVRKGEKGALVEYWKFREEVPITDAEGRPVLGEDGQPKTKTVALERPKVFRAVVFNAAQMDNVPELAMAPRGYEWDPEERAESILVSSGARIFHDQADRAFYSPMADEIHLPSREQFPDSAAYYSTSLHELGHWTGHESRLGRDLSGGFGSQDYAKEELRAELASYFLADKLGIPYDPEQHAAYVKSWVRVLKEDKNEIFRASRDAEQITEYILGLDQDVQREKTLELQRDAGGPDLNKEPRERFRVDLVAADGKILKRSVFDEPVAAMTAYAGMTRTGFGKEHGAGSYVALVDKEQQFDAAFVAEHGGITYRQQFGREDGRALFAEVERGLQKGEGLTPNPRPPVGTPEYLEAVKAERLQREADGDLGVLRQAAHQRVGPGHYFATWAGEMPVMGPVIAETRSSFALHHEAENVVYVMAKVAFRELPRVGQVVAINSIFEGEPQLTLAGAGREVATGLIPNFVPPQRTEAHLARLREQQQGGADDYHHLRGIVEEAHPGASFGVWAGNDPVKVTVVAETRHSFAVYDPETNSGLLLRKLSFQQLPKPGQVVEIGATVDGIRSIKLIEMERAAQITPENTPQQAQERPQAVRQARRAGEPTPDALMLAVPFKERTQAKEAGAIWAPEAKVWWAPADADQAKLQQWIQAPQPVKEVVADQAPAKAPQQAQERPQAARQARRAGEPTPDALMLAVPFKERTQAKEAGAIWAPEAKVWWAPADADQAKLQKWLAGPAKAMEQPATTEQAIRADFASAIKQAGLELNGDPIMDGNLHRIGTREKPNGKDGAYVGYLDGRPSGFIQNFSSGLKENWTFQGAELNDEQRAELAAQAAINKQRRAAELAEQHEKAAGKAQWRWEQGADMREGDSTPYTERKQVPAVGLRRIGDDLLVPLRDVDGKLWAVQTVFPEKKAWVERSGENRLVPLAELSAEELAKGVDPMDKVFTKGAKKEGNFHLLGEVRPGEPVVVVEGYATGASVHLATGVTVAVAFDSGNLDPVVGAIKSRHPTSELFIGADDDRFPKPGREGQNAGLLKALEAAQRHGVGVIVPKFTGPGRLTDFNDLHVSEGLEVVRSQISEGMATGLQASRDVAASLAKSRLGPDAKTVTPGPDARYSGEVLGVSDYHAAQSIGRGQAVVHPVSKLDKPLKTGHVATVQYRDGRGQVDDRQKTKDKQIER